MAETRERPHVVQRPYQRLAGVDDALQHVQRDHAVVNPVQVDDVGLAELGQVGDVLACGAKIETIAMLAAQLILHV